MRISDWSSDVCSSDLLGQRAALRAEIDHPGRGLVGRPRCGDAGAQRVDHHHHAGAAAEGAVIDAAVVAFGVVARVPAQQRQQPALLRAPDYAVAGDLGDERSEEHTSELQSLMRISYAVFCLKKKKLITTYH